MKTTAEKIAIMQAFLEGKTIQIKPPHSDWDDWNRVIVGEPTWDWQLNDYRVAPKPLEFWVRAVDSYSVAFYDKRGAECMDSVKIHGGRAVLMREVTE